MGAALIKYDKLIRTYLFKGIRLWLVANAALWPIALAIHGFLQSRRRALDGRRRYVLVTGAASGIGEVVARHLHAKGDCIILADINAIRVTEISNELNAEDDTRSLPISMDVSSNDSVEEGIAAVKAWLGDNKLHAVCNIAGLLRGGPLFEMKQQDLELVMDVNVLGTARVSRACFPLMHGALPFEEGDDKFSPRIINTASEISYSRVCAGFNGPYAMSKFAVEAFSATLRQELMMLDSRIHVAVLNPGAHTTPMALCQEAGNPGSFGSMAEDSALWKQQLKSGHAVAASYMRKHMRDPIHIARHVYHIVHCREPDYNYPINVSLEMRLASFTPQWILDYVTVSMFPK